MALKEGQLASKYRSGGLTRRDKYLILATGCVFCCAAALVAAPAEAALISNMWAGSGSTGMRSNTDLVWQLSNANLGGNASPNATTYLIPGQELIIGVYTADYLSRGPVSAASMVDLNNSDIVHQTAGLEIHSQGRGILSSGTYYMGCGMGGENICGDMNASAYCEMAGVTSNIMHESLDYEHLSTIDAYAVELPDAMEVQIQGSGNGRATTGFEGYSIAGLAFSNEPGYRNEFRDSHTVSGDFAFSQLSQWTSFRNRFDVELL